MTRCRASSNPMAAVTTPGALVPNIFSSGRCVEIATKPPDSRSLSTTATASAPPSSGSVAVPSSSSTTSVCGDALSRIPVSFDTWAENVLRLSAIDCASPMSARIWSNHGNSASSAGIGTPACAMAESTPSVLSTTVLPPALGPLTIKARRLPSNRRLMGTGRRWSCANRSCSKGCRASVRTIRASEESLNFGRQQANS